jgi:hypothetical protein
MEEEKQIIDAAKALGINELLPEIYHDMLQPAARELGNGLATIAKTVNLSLAPLEAGIWGYEQIKDWLAVRITSILTKRKVSKIEKPPLSIAGPLVFQLIFAKDEPELRELYASLLSSAMDASETSAHPSFVSIIQQLTPDEAKILKYITSLDVDWPRLEEYDEAEGYAQTSVQDQFKNWCEKADVFHLKKSDAYMDNLLRLRILNLFTQTNTEYEPGSYDRHDDYGPSVTNKEFALLELSSFGRLFLDACIEKKKPNE